MAPIAQSVNTMLAFVTRPVRKVKRFLAIVENLVNTSSFGRFFRLHDSGHPNVLIGSSFWKEIRAGLTTFFTMAYIISVNAVMIAQSGGTCECDRSVDPKCILSADYNTCVDGIQKDLVTATAVISGVSTIVFGILTNLPVALAPGMGLNAYFTYQVVGFHGTGNISYRLALTAVFVEGFIFVFLALIGMRQWLVKLIPECVKIASGVGIGLFLTEVGLSYPSGIGLVTGSSSTVLQIGGCPPQYRDAVSGSCDSHLMQNPQLWIGVIFGGFLTAYLICYKVRLAFVIGIATVSIVSWPRGTSFTLFDYTPNGEARWEFFKKVVTLHPIQSTLGVQDWNVSAQGRQFALALFTFLYVDIVDCTATLYSMARFAGVVDQDTDDFPRSTVAYCTDATFISLGSLMGLSPVTVFIESGAGVSEGGKTGLTALTTGICFLISIFFAPIFASIPPWATGCTLLLVGCMMMRQVTQINWAYMGDTLPAFVTIALMPLTYSVAYGLIGGLMTYAALNGAILITRKVTFGKLVPEDFDQSQVWSWKPHRNQLPWFVRAGIKSWNYISGGPKKPESELGKDIDSVEGDFPEASGLSNHHTSTIPLTNTP